MREIISAYLEPLDIFEKIGGKKSELSDGSLGFICGIIKKDRPKCIVEIGVSAGGTTCAVLNCLEKLGLESKVYSVDLSETYHFDTSKRCGFQIEDARKYLKKSADHKLFLGQNIAETLLQNEEKFKEGIDLLILDTIHYLPGELLDFIVCLPYMARNAVVVLDDLIFAHGGENTQAIATRALFDALVGDSVYPKQDLFPNLAAVRLNDDTEKYREKLLSALVIPWYYRMEEEDLSKYRKIVEKFYTEDEKLLFEQAVNINKRTLIKKDSIKNELHKILELFKDRNIKAVIYGAGQRGIALNGFLEDRGLHIEGYVISDDRSKDALAWMNKKIFWLSELQKDVNNYKIIVAAADREIIYNLENRHISYVEAPGFIFPFIKNYNKYICEQ